MNRESSPHRASEFFGLHPPSAARRPSHGLDTPVVALFAMPAIADLVFVGLHVLWANDLLNHAFFAITKDRGYAEVYQYIKEF